MIESQRLPREPAQSRSLYRHLIQAWLGPPPGALWALLRAPRGGAASASPAASRGERGRTPPPPPAASASGGSVLTRALARTGALDRFGVGREVRGLA